MHSDLELCCDEIIAFFVGLVILGLYEFDLLGAYPIIIELKTMLDGT